MEVIPYNYYFCLSSLGLDIIIPSYHGLIPAHNIIIVDTLVADQPVKNTHGSSVDELPPHLNPIPCLN